MMWQSAIVRWGLGFMFAIAAAASDDSMSLSNEHLRLGLDPQNGQLVELTEIASQHDFVGVCGPAPLWDAVLLRADGEAFSLSATQAQHFEVQTMGANVLKLRWSDFEEPRLQVEATVALDAREPVSRWIISVTDLGPLRLRQVRFPIVPNIPEQPDEHLAVPVWLGQLAANPRQNVLTNQVPRYEWDYPGGSSLQCLALYGEEAGLFLSCDDTNAFRKSFTVWLDDDQRLQAGLIHLPENDGSADYTLPYQVVLGTFRGDWLTAAKQYRRWATNQWWAIQSRARTGAVPGWVRDTALWVWNRGRSEQVLQPAGVLQQQLGLPVSVFWHWWHGCAYNVGFPDYLPPREGERSFTNALRQAHAQGIPAIVYMNQRLWGMTTAMLDEPRRGGPLR